MLKKLTFVLLRATLIHVLVREFIQRRRVTILLYHAPAPDVLDRHLHALSKSYTFITFREFLDASEHKQKLPPKALILTLDDGHASNHALLPVLKKYDVRATIFLCSRIVGTNRHFWFKHPQAKQEIALLKTLDNGERLERLEKLDFRECQAYEDRQALSWDEVDEMREWVDFQPHSMFHPILPRCSEERVHEEIAKSKSDLEERGFAADVFAFPNGDYTKREMRIVQASGYRCSMSIDSGFNTDATDMYRLKRIGIPDGGEISELMLRASGVWSFFRVFVKGRYQSQDPDC